MIIVSRIKLFALIVNFILLIILNFVLPNDTINDFGLKFFVYSICSILILAIIQKSILSAVNILFVTFVLFQAGIPIAYFLFDGYSSFYISFFSETNILESCKLTLISIEILTFSLIIFCKNNSSTNKTIFIKFQFIENKKFMYKIGNNLFWLSAIVVVPLYVYVANLTIQYGFSQATRGIISSNNIFNLCRAFFFPSFFIMLCYGRNAKSYNYAKLFFLFVCVLALIIGDRTEGILYLFAYCYYSNYNYLKNINNQLRLIVFISLILYVAVYIGKARVNYSTENISVFKSIIEEMGFNFFSICFVRTYIPDYFDFEYGSTYINSIVCMIPKSIDFLDYLKPLRDSLPTLWLYDLNSVFYDGLFDFGTGFSFMAESYMNFSSYGSFTSAVYGFVLCLIFSNCSERISCWQRYIQIIFFISFLTFPRRSFSELLNVIEYSIFGVFVLSYVLFTAFKRKI